MGYRFRRLISASTFVRLAISVLLALVIWGFIVWETNPEVTREFQNIAITAEDVPADMLVVGGLPSATVTIKGPQDVVQGIVPSDVTASVDFSQVEGPGINEYEIQVDAPSEVREVIVEPSSIEVELDLIVTSTFQISLLEDETRPASVTSIEASTEVASIQGPQDLVDRVDSVILPVDLEGHRESFSEPVELVPVAADGTLVTGVEVSPTTVELTVTFESTSRDVPVVVVCACIVDDQLQETVLQDAAAIPSTIRLSGPSSTLINLSQVETVPVDISQLDQSGWILDVALNTADIPESVSLSDRTVDVWVPVAPARLEIQEVELKVLGLAEGLDVELSTETVSVVLTGDNQVLNEPESLNIMAIVNVTDLTTGSYTVDVEIVVPAGVTFESVNPETVRLTISPVTTTANRLRQLDDPPPTRGIR